LGGGFGSAADSQPVTASDNNETRARVFIAWRYSTLRYAVNLLRRPLQPDAQRTADRGCVHKINGTKRTMR
jgi:hypothetical protein